MKHAVKTSIAGCLGIAVTGVSSGFAVSNWSLHIVSV